MAKYRFPGKALKLNGRRKIRYENWAKNCATEDNYSCQIVRGYKLFREVFGSSEEEGDADFEGFDIGGGPSKAVCQRLVDLGYAKSCNGSKLPGVSQTLDKRTSKKKQHLTPPPQDGLSLTSNKSEAPSLNVVGARKKSGRIRKPSRKALEGDGGSEEWKSEAENSNEGPTEACSSSPKNKRSVQANKSRNEIEITPLGIPSRSTPSPEREGGDRVSRNIALYAETISSTAPAQPARPTRRSIAEANERANQAAPAPHIQEKIEKILQSPWDGRAKLSATNKVVPSSNAHSMAVSKNILRKARLNLNKRTLQKIRNPVSVQNLLMQQGEELSDGSCGICQLRGRCEMLHSTSCCQHCAAFLTSLAERPPQQELLCLRECGGCQLVGISIEERCKACWLCQALLCCTLPSLLHDRMRKKLPQYLKEKVPTSLARSVYVSEACAGLNSSKMNGKHSANSTHGVPAALPDMSGGMFGSIVDLPGGWKRKTGPEVVVISPSGEKFKSIPKLEEYLQKLGICTDARVLFGGSAPATDNAMDKKSHPSVGQGDEQQLFPKPEQVSFHKKKKKKKKKKKHKSRSRSKDEMKLFVGSNGNNNNCVTTTLPGGWIRRTIFRHSGNKAKFDVYVLSPDGRTFRSRKQLSAYFQQIGKVDDITKYFPLFHEKGSPTATSSERTETESSTEPDSSSELLSDTDANDVLSLDGSDSEEETASSAVAKGPENPPKESGKACLAAGGNCATEQLDVSFASGGDASQEDFVGFDNKCVVVQSEIANNHKCKDDRDDSPRTDDNSGDISCDNNSSVAVVKTKRSSISFKVPFSHYSNEDIGLSDKKETSVQHEENQSKKNESLPEGQKCDKENTSIPVEQLCVPKNTPAPDIQKLEVEVPKFKAFQTQHLGNGWSRKIKWNQDGTGKVSFVVTPAGSKIQSNLELQAYFKKEGGSTLDAAKFFPINLKREDVPEKVAVVPRVCKPKQASLKKDKKKLDVPADVSVSVADGRSDAAAPLPVESSGGPRIKRVCRSLEQALGMPRATFPVLEDKENRDVLETESSDSVSYESASAVTSDAGAPHTDLGARKKVKKQAKVYSVTLTATGKVLRKTMWCNKCSGCLIPNCRECVHCLDMIKYGGPGSKKKPCIKRRCINPRLSVHSSAQLQPQAAAADAQKLPNQKQAQQQGSSAVRSDTPEVNGVPPASSQPLVPVLSAATGKKIPQKAAKRALKKMADMQKRAEVEEQEDLADEKWRRQKKEHDTAFKDQDKNVFVPQQIVRPIEEVKDRVDAEVSKCVAPGALVNIDYWQGCGGTGVQHRGFPVLQAAPLHLTPLCFRCGSAGKEEMLWCSWCCEGVHPYCLEEGEGPQSNREEQSWVCRRCAVCHVCGAGSWQDRAPHQASLALHRCSACLYYFHLQCLGPGAHDSCHPPDDALWEWDLLRHLRWSFPSAQPVFLVENDEAVAPPQSSVAAVTSPQDSSSPSAWSKENYGATVSSRVGFHKICVYSSSATAELSQNLPAEEVDATVLTVLDDNIELRNTSDDPLLYVLPSATAKKVEDPAALELPEVTCVADELGELDLMEIEGMDLDAIMDGLEDAEAEDLYEEQYSEEEVIELVVNYNLEVPPCASPRVVCTTKDDEYLSLGYKKITNYPATRFELSNFRVLQMALVELFTALGFPHVKELEAKKLIKYRPRGRRKLIHPKVTAPCRCDSDTDTASEGSSDDESADNPCDLDWSSVLRIRRHEVQEKLRARLAEREAKLKRAKELENAREKQLKTKTQPSKKERKPFKKSKCIGSKRPSVDQDEEPEDDEWEPLPKKKKIKKKIKDDDRTENVAFSQDDEFFFRPPSDEEDLETFRSTVAGRWRPSNFKELDVWLASRDKLIKGADSVEEDESQLIAKLIEGSPNHSDVEISGDDTEHPVKMDESGSDSGSHELGFRPRSSGICKAKIKAVRKGASLAIPNKKLKKKLDFDRKLHARGRRVLKKLKQKKRRKIALADKFELSGLNERLKKKEKAEWPTLSKLSNSIARKRELTTSMKMVKRKNEYKRKIKADGQIIASTPLPNFDFADPPSPEIVLGSEGERVILECQEPTGVGSTDEDCSQSYILEVLGSEATTDGVEVVLHSGFETESPTAKRPRDDSNDNVDEEMNSYSPKRQRYDDANENRGKKTTVLEESFESSTDSESVLSPVEVINISQSDVTTDSLPPTAIEQRPMSSNTSVRSSRRVSCGRASQLASMRKALLDM